MGNRRFEMHEYRHILARMRQGESNRSLAKTGLIGRNKAAVLRSTAHRHGWLETTSPLPDDQELARVLAVPAIRQQDSSLASYAREVKGWHSQGISGTVIHRTLQEKYGFNDSYSAVRRFLQKLQKATPPEATVMLDHEPGDCTQIDFGTGPLIVDVFTGEEFKTWFFVMTLAWSRHQYVEMVRDQKVLTWLGCHHRALFYDNPRYQTVKTILVKELDYIDPPKSSQQLSNVYTGDGAFCRDTNTLLSQ